MLSPVRHLFGAVVNLTSLLHLLLKILLAVVVELVKMTMLFIVNGHLEALSKALAKEMTSISLKELIKTQALLETDGDFDVLYSMLSDKNIDGAKLHIKCKKNGVSDKILVDFPSVQISIPVLCKEWDTRKQTPLVAFVPYGEDDKKMAYIRGYDSDGKVYKITTKEIPSQPIIVISVSERHDASGKILPQYIQKKNARLANSSESIYWMHFQDLGSFEPWVKGRPEIRLTIAGVRNAQVVNPVYTGYWNPTRYTVENYAGWTLDQFAFTWTEDYGMYVTYIWIEEDGGAYDSQPISLSWQPSTPGSITAFSTTLSKGNDDDEMGTYTIYKGDANYQIYGSNFRFKLKFNE